MTEVVNSAGVACQTDLGQGLTDRDDKLIFWYTLSALGFVVFLIHFCSDVNTVNLGESRHCDTYKGIFIVILCCL